MEKRKSFQFENPRQAKNYDSLNRFVGSGPASFYRDACKIMVEDSDLETKTHLVAHLLREVFSWLVEIMLPINYEKPSSDNNYAQKMKNVATFYSIDEKDPMFQFWLQKIGSKSDGLDKWAHRESWESARPPSKEFQELWNGVAPLLEFLLDKIESNYLKYTKQLDSITAKPKLTERDIKEIKKHIPLNQITLGYFFDKLTDYGCLPVLREKGFFKYPKAPFEHEDGGVSFPFWPQMTYLVKASKVEKAQSEVLLICRDLKTDNVQIRTQILEVALNLPPSMAVQLVKKALVWLADSLSWFRFEKYGELMIHLAKGGYQKEALELANKIFEIKPNPRTAKIVKGYTFPNEPVSVIDEHHYGEILNDNIPTLVDFAGIEAIKILLDKIDDYIDLSSNGTKRRSKDSLSFVWRPSIEASRQSYNHGVRDLLIDAVRDASERFLTKHPKKILALVKELDGRNLTICRRLALHLLRKFPKGAEKKIVEELLNKKEFGEGMKFTHEYFLLAESHSKLLNKGQREQIWTWIKNGPNLKEYKKSIAESGEKNHDKELQYRKNWQLYHLVPFKELDSNWKKRFDELEAESGKPEHPSFKTWMQEGNSGSFGPKSFISSDVLEKTSPKEVIDKLKSWKPKSSDPRAPSREGVGRQLTAEIARDPNKWITALPLISRLDPTYVRAVLRGYLEALRNGKKFDWDPLLDLSISVLDHPIEVKTRKPSVPFGDDPDWNWCRNTVAELINEGLKKHTGQLSVKLKGKVWFVLEPLTYDTDPTPEQEKEYLSSDPDPLSLAINTTRGDAVEAAIEYGIWLKKSKKETEQSKWSLSKSAPELKKVLEVHLNISKDPSIAIRSIYGENLRRLTWLDEGWVKTNQDLIFPKNPKQQSHFDAVWETYIQFVDPYGNLLSIVKPQYERAIRELGKHHDPKHYLENPDQNLAHHITVFYFRGLLDLKSGLIADFYKIASTELKSNIFDFIGRLAKKEDSIPEKILTKWVELAEYRISIIEDRGASQNDIKEFQSFSWWVASGKFDEGWVLNKLLVILKMGCDLEGNHLIMEKFVGLVDRFPLEVVQCSKLMVENNKKGWGIISWREPLKSVLKTVLSSKNETAKTEAVKFIQRLAARGFLEFSELIP